jgi:lipopolysaccharide transport system permease protein
METRLQGPDVTAVSRDRPPPDGHPTTRTVVIQPTRGRGALGLRELWSYRELLYFMVWRDVKVRYKQTAIGAGWAILQPFMMMVVFSIFLGKLAKIQPNNGIPYPVFVYTALVPWTLFAATLGASSDSLVGNANLISKVYFPRLLLPLAAAGSFIFDFLLAMVVLVGLMTYYGLHPGWGIVALPALVVLAVLTAVSVGIWLTALNVRYRDVRYAVPFLVQIWLFSSPVAYPSTLVPAHWRTLYGLNPMAGVVEGFRWALLGRGSAPGPLIAVSTAVVLVILAGGVYYFKRTERTFADVV